MAKSPAPDSGSEDSFEEEETEKFNNIEALKTEKHSANALEAINPNETVCSDGIDDEESADEVGIGNEDEIEKEKEIDHEHENTPHPIHNLSAIIPSKPEIVKEDTKSPTYEVMVKTAIKALNEPHGSSLPAIKKYILANFNILSQTRFAFLVLKHLKKAVTEGKMKQTKMKFKLIEVEKKSKAKKKETTKKPTKKSPKKKTVALTSNAQKENKSVTNKKAKPKSKADPAKNEKTAKIADKPKKTSNKETSAEVNKATTSRTTKTVKTTNVNNEIPTTSTKKKQVTKKPDKPTLKVVPIPHRRPTLEKNKKKQGTKKSNSNTEKNLAEKDPAPKKASRPVRGVKKPANS